MSARNSPRLANWLMHRFNVSEAAIGDMIERYYGGRSSTWYWWQALAATTLTVLRDIRTHRTLALRAILVGWVAQWVLLFLLRRPVRDLSNVVGKWIWNWTIENEFDRVRALWFGGLGGVGVPVFLTMVAVAALTGWIVAVFHRSQQATLVTLYAASMPIFGGVWLYRESSVAHPTWSFLCFVIPLSALLGGFATSGSLGHGQIRLMTKDE